MACSVLVQTVHARLEESFTCLCPPPSKHPTPPAGCYFNLFRLMAKCGVLENLLLKDHTHTFVNTVRGSSSSSSSRGQLAC